MMQERFNVSGAMLVKLFGRPDEERAAFDQRAAGVRDIGIKQATYQRMFFVGLSLTAALATAFAYGFGGVAVVNHAMSLGTVVALTAVPRAPLRTAAPALERPGRPHERGRQLRAGLRGPRHRPHDQGGTRRRRRSPRAGDGRVPRRALQLPDRRGGLDRLARGGRDARAHRPRRGAARDLLHASSRAASSRSSDPPGRARPRSRR